MVRRPDVIVGTSPQFFTNCAGWMLSVFRHRPFVFEPRDLWPESIKTVGAMRDSVALRAMEGLELFLYRKAKAVVAVTESFKRNLISRGIDGNKIHVVTNGVDLSRFQPLRPDETLVAQLGLSTPQPPVIPARMQRLRDNGLAAAPRYERAALAQRMLGVLEAVAAKT